MNETIGTIIAIGLIFMIFGTPINQGFLKVIKCIKF